MSRLRKRDLSRSTAALTLALLALLSMAGAGAAAGDGLSDLAGPLRLLAQNAARTASGPQLPSPLAESHDASPGSPGAIQFDVATQESIPPKALATAPATRCPSRAAETIPPA